ncbi:hypothetical protein GLAREA_03466 [Glarea lozoyensis ATCC 20868]|uniref:Uncharacterized protein n=1 Tax=Glarea lozoyensis (strain ATCC 20868 / MF5171) TaxID=1116229 RepID=S3D013_GLAL2|nr:uncharacterized protein GLAREA_03466 [Glarea lozoyensis ATCC 20868]EPE30499.1 hypothetical protein GLAREA_03466 [Glarea lozoyensis ATCC 20868]
MDLNNRLVIKIEVDILVTKTYVEPGQLHPECPLRAQPVTTVFHLTRHDPILALEDLYLHDFLDWVQENANDKRSEIANRHPRVRDHTWRAKNLYWIEDANEDMIPVLVQDETRFNIALDTLGVADTRNKGVFLVTIVEDDDGEGNGDHASTTAGRGSDGGETSPGTKAGVKCKVNGNGKGKKEE